MSQTVLLKSVDIHIPGYRILRPLGEGGMASVFLAVQESLDREVALKIMAPALAANSEFTERFIKEGRITAKLAHANLVNVFDIGSHGTVYYLAAEYIPGGSLRERVQAGMSVGEALDEAQANALKAKVDAVYAKVEDENRYDMAAFVASLRELRRAAAG